MDSRIWLAVLVQMQARGLSFQVWIVQARMSALNWRTEVVGAAAEFLSGQVGEPAFDEVDA